MESSQTNGKATWRLTGDLILEETEPVREGFYEWFKSNSDLDLDIDLKNLNRIDASGISLLISFQNVLSNHQKQLNLLNVPHSVLTLLQRNNLHLYFKITTE